MASKPTFVLVPGNFLPPAYYSGVVKLLESHSFATRLITLKSTGSNEPLSSNKPDVIAIRETIEHLVEAGKDAIIVAHSYAGVPTCEAVKGLGKRERLALGKTGGVVKLVFVTAWVLQEGETPLAVIERNSMEATWARFDEINVYADDPIYALHNDTSEETAIYWSKYTTHSDLAAFATPLQYAAWRHIPSTYLICELDKCILPHVHEDMIKRTEGKVNVLRLMSGHMPMLSMPERFAEALEKEALAV